MGVEYLPQVDERDRQIGVKTWKSFFRTGLIHRSAALFLFNSRRELLLQRRSENKMLYPGLYAFSASCFVPVGETYDEAMTREAMEELGVDAALKRLGKYRFRDDYDHAFFSLYAGLYDGKITLQREEVDDARWFSGPEVKEMVAARPEKFAPPFIFAMSHYDRLQRIVQPSPPLP